MTKLFQLTLMIEGRDDLQVCGEFNNDEHTILLNYMEQYEQLAKSKPFREGFPCKIQMKGNQETPFGIEVSLPDDDIISILLHRLRPFILQKEPASFIRVTSLIGKRVEDLFIRQLLRRQHKIYNCQQLQKHMKITSNDVVVNSERVLADWLNSYEYHRDPDKRETMDALFERIPDKLMRGIIVSMLSEKARAIRNVASLTAVLLGNGNRLQFSVNELI